MMPVRGNLRLMAMETQLLNLAITRFTATPLSVQVSSLTATSLVQPDEPLATEQPLIYLVKDRIAK